MSCIFYGGTLSDVKEVVERGADVNYCLQPVKLYPLHITNTLDIAQYLVSKGADVNCRNRYGYNTISI